MEIRNVELAERLIKKRNSLVRMRDLLKYSTKIATISITALKGEKKVESIENDEPFNGCFLALLEKQIEEVENVLKSL